MGNIPEAAAAEIRLSLLSLLGNKGRNRGGQRYKAVPQQYGRDIKNVRKQYALDPEMAEKRNGISAFLFYAVNIPLADIAVFFKQPVYSVYRLGIFFLNIAASHKRSIKPFILVKRIGFFCPTVGQ